MAQAHPSFAGCGGSMSRSAALRHRPSQSLRPEKSNEINGLAASRLSALILRKSGHYTKRYNVILHNIEQHNVSVYNITVDTP